MGEDQAGNPNQFYAAALGYWRAHLPNATFVTDKRDLSDVLTYLAGGTGLIGNVYIVSHANEDGTLSFGLDAADTDHHLTVNELRAALHPSSGTSALASIASRVDASTGIHIKGCDIGRTQAMVDLVDEAFGGAGIVDAPTHEQHYSWDQTLATRARAAFRAEIEAAHPMPPPVNASLRGQARVQAVTARQAAVRARNQAVQADVRSRAAEADARANAAGYVESFTGPMFQRTGTQLYTVAELRAEIDRLYPHLSDRAADSWRRSSRPPTGGRPRSSDRRERSASAVSGCSAITGNSQGFLDPRNLVEAQRALGNQYPAGFVATAVRTTHAPVAGGFQTTIVVDGTVPDGDGGRRPETMTFPPGGTTPDDASLLASSRGLVNNPDRYSWRIQETHDATTGQTTHTAIGERVITYLHHESLNAGAHDHFTRPSTDTDFYGRSTYAPPAPAAPAPAP